MSSSEAAAGRVVLITGAASGMGAGHGRTLAADGWAVALADVSDTSDLVAEITAAGGTASGYRLDVTEPEQWAKTVEGIGSTYGALHGLVNNAGISRRLRFMGTSHDVWRRVLSINLDGPFYGIQAVAPLMRDSGGGSIVNISSISGQIGYFSPSYSTSKWGLRGLTKSAAGELAAWRIRVNSVHPGLVRTPLLDGSDSFVASAVASIPMGRMAQPEEITAVVSFLLGDASAYISGAEVTVDGAMVSNGLYHRILAEMEGDLS